MRHNKIDNPFKKMESENLPENMKEKVMTSVRLVTLLGDFTELFTIRLVSSVSKMLDLMGRKTDKGDPPLNTASNE